MVYQVASNIIGKIIRESGVKLIPKFAKTFQKYDVRIHRGLYGQAGGRGVRHGRDIGSIVAGTVRGFIEDDGLDAGFQTPDDGPSSSKGKAYRGYKRGNFRRSSKYKRCYPYRR